MATTRIKKLMTPDEMVKEDSWGFNFLREERLHSGNMIHRTNDKQDPKLGIVPELMNKDDDKSSEALSMTSRTESYNPESCESSHNGVSLSIWYHRRFCSLLHEVGCWMRLVAPFCCFFFHMYFYFLGIGPCWWVLPGVREGFVLSNNWFWCDGNLFTSFVVQ